MLTRISKNEISETLNQHIEKSAIGQAAKKAVEGHITISEYVHASKKAYAAVALQVTNGNQSRAARIAGIHRNTFARLIEEEGLQQFCFQVASKKPVKSTFAQENTQSKNGAMRAKA